MKFCLESLAGKEEDSPLVTLTTEPTAFSTSSVSKRSLRRLRVEWMYGSRGTDLLWLNDEVNIIDKL